MVKTLCSILICLVLQRSILLSFQYHKETIISIMERRIYLINTTPKMLFIKDFKKKGLYTFGICVNALTVFHSGADASWPTCRSAKNCPPLLNTCICPKPIPLTPSSSLSPFLYTMADITLEARRGLLICSQLQPCKLCSGKDFKLCWNQEEQPETLSKQTSDEVCHVKVWLCVRSSNDKML